MVPENYYDVTRWPVGNPYQDIGEVINSIIADIKSRQTETDINDGGKPGAAIFIPPGDYHLTTQVLIDISYLKIMGAGHGFVSSSIRFNTPADEWANLHDLWPGGSRILVDLCPQDGDEEHAGAAFYVKRSGAPRISSVAFENFCIDGLHFVDDGLGNNDPENTYTNGKTGIYIASAQDAFRITGMGFIYLEHGLTAYNSDAMAIHNNFIAECGNCIELRGAGQASKITDNLIGAGYKGYSIYAQNFGGLLISTNNIFPRGASSVHLSGVVRSCVTSNRFHSFYPGMLIMENNCAENLISANHFLRDREPWPPMQAYDNGRDDTYGLLYIEGSNNSIIANHISETLDVQYLKPRGIKPIVIRLVAGKENYLANNHIVATTEASAAQAQPSEEDACFAAQVSALLTTDRLKALDAVAVLVEKSSAQNTILDSGSDSQVLMDRAVNAFRATPVPGTI
ncbi:right-handed parallel beta-helix repeat-containing protein [Klebsiella grimontii]|jgi:inulin fructotransferase (DFA-I-forming)|uniref:Inulin fructotransferase (DFA-I-forming) n=1 Tax=Klebsiella grimontii TaxID=2058152 RepID=A0A285AVK4_9ENTR|nr:MULTISPECIES: NosD domain-containing protein [Klebsiella]OQR48183.1 fructotransferase [Klebsiella oxytoca]MBX4742149.1 right-handed parallel beta-helix repeat-containing protein [Klebsiella sp. CVUAS 10975.2]MBZ6758271.1 right-handed parallel beta-helix repeat-containing protein [Klebsiella grimontii]MBZ6972393.1 right-handed parallel beta-helix repeat-containing protein [Klebsiella grimontii]MBZ7215362.1 right-handed parallel beta-helix repeat-containing protein [Klebsiella grimontii]